MNLDKMYAVDEKAALNGKWMVTREGFKVKVAKFGNRNFVARLAELQKPHAALLASSADTSELMSELVTQAMSDTILLDWEAVSNKKPVPYTSELGFQYMTKYPDFKEDISELSLNRLNYKPEDIAGKSSLPLNGGRDTQKTTTSIAE